MKGLTAIYLGKIVDKKHFRTFIYSADGSSKVVNSWEEYEQHMETGIWFSSLDEVDSSDKKKESKKSKVKKDASLGVSR